MSYCNSCVDLKAELAKLQMKFAEVVARKDKQINVAERALNLVIGESKEIYIVNTAREGKRKMCEV